MAELRDGLVAVVREDCPTCKLVEPVLRELRARGAPLVVYTQDDPAFPTGLDPVDDTSLDVSFALDVETVPTLARVERGVVVDRLSGWQREAWERLTGVSGLGPALPEFRPGCGSRTLDPDVAELRARVLGDRVLRSRRVELAAQEDDIEAAYARGWSDGLPVVPPTVGRVMRMLEGTARKPDEVIAVVPPDLIGCTVEKVAVNAVMAGCLPEYLDVVIAAVQAACTDEFNMHGLLATTWFSGPVVIVGGPVVKSIGMNDGVNALGQGNRANATIGRALQLVVRNVGGGRPGEIDRATLGNPGKYSFCFAERSGGDGWPTLAEEGGVAPPASGVTLFAGSGVQGVADQRSRTPESLAASFALCLATVAHPKLAQSWDALLVVSPEHLRTFREAGWSKQRLRDEIQTLAERPGEQLVAGAGGCAEGMPDAVAGQRVKKFRDGGLLIACAGGEAGMFSAVIGGWVSGPGGSQPVTRRIWP